MVVSVFVGNEGDKLGDILFNLRQVLDKVSLVELNVIIIVVLVSDSCTKLSFPKLLSHVGYTLLYLLELLTNLLTFKSHLFLLSNKTVTLSFQLFDLILLLVLIHLFQVFVHLDLRIKVFVVLLIRIVFLTKHVYIVVQTVILVFSLNVSCHNLINV